LKKSCPAGTKLFGTKREDHMLAILKDLQQMFSVETFDRATYLQNYLWIADYFQLLSTII
jgi:hypothetical protein